MFRKTLSTLTIAVALITASCSSNSDKVDLPIHAEWSVISMSGYEGDIQADHIPTLRMVLANVHGSAGCNDYQGRFMMLDHKLSFNASEFAVTRKMCPPVIMEVEDVFLQNMSMVESWQINSDNELILSNDVGEEVLRFEYIKAIEPEEKK
ncbi:MAG: META domain-containing protein [Flavobacteriia bacterium]|nr:META domain-containing protein [Flavobacteriia bacterium]